jgi:hypothetical protein
MGALEAFTIILSVVSTVISVVAFFASLKFYRDGVQLQQRANDALTKIEEKTQFIQIQVGGMFDKTLDAALGKHEVLSVQFEEINEQLEQAKTKLIEESIRQIGTAGEQERTRLTKLVDGQMNLIREKVETTRESAEELVGYEGLSGTIVEMLQHRAAGMEADRMYEILYGDPAFPGSPSRNLFSDLLRQLRKRGTLIKVGPRYHFNAPTSPSPAASSSTKV